MECNRCKTEHDGTYGSGKFCGRACANARTHSSATKKKIAKSINVFFAGKPSKTHRYICEKCGCDFDCEKPIKKGRHHHCRACRRNVLRTKGSAVSLMELSKRTVSKILTRACKGCAICGWREATCDIHHIVPRKKGGTDDHSNLIILCPNHHRMAHHKKVPMHEMEKRTLEKTFKDWRVYYDCSGRRKLKKPGRYASG